MSEQPQWEPNVFRKLDAKIAELNVYFDYKKKQAVLD